MQTREFIYWFNIDDVGEEREYDLTGELPIPRIGEFLHRRGRDWKVFHISIQSASGAENPIVNIYLTDKYYAS